MSRHLCLSVCLPVRLSFSVSLPVCVWWGQVEASAGADMAVIMAGYEPQMRELFKNCNNPGLNRRFNLDEALVFEDFSDEDLKTVSQSASQSINERVSDRVSQ